MIKFLPCTIITAASVIENELVFKFKHAEKVDLVKWQVTSLVKNQLHSSEGSIDGERDFYFRRRVDLNSTACTSSLRQYQFTLLGKRRHCVNNLPRVTTWSRVAGTQTWPLRHQATENYNTRKHYKVN